MNFTNSYLSDFANIKNVQLFENWPIFGDLIASFLQNNGYNILLHKRHFMHFWVNSRNVTGRHRPSQTVTNRHWPLNLHTTSL